jgi:hypothetical protein
MAFFERGLLLENELSYVLPQNIFLKSTIASIISIIFIFKLVVRITKEQASDDHKYNKKKQYKKDLNARK